MKRIIGLAEYEFHDKVPDSVLEEHGSDCKVYGSIDQEAHKIYIRKDIKNSALRSQVTWHEILHALDCQLELGLEEAQLMVLARALVFTMAENQDLCKITL